MGAQVTVSRPIAAPPEQVWELVADVTRMGEWSPETTGCEWTGGATQPAVGARFRGSNRIGWRRWSTTCEVSACEPGRTFAFEVRTGPLAVATWSYVLTPTDDGCVVEEAWIDRRGPVIKVVGTLASGVGDRAAHNRRNMEATLDRIAAAAEGRRTTAEPPTSP